MRHGIIGFLLAAVTIPWGDVPAARAAARPDLDAWFGTLSAGMWVKVEGKLAGNGTLYASDIKIFQGELDEYEVSSTVDRVDVLNTSLHLECGITVTATPRTEIEGPKSKPHVGFAYLEVGDRIEVEGQLQREGSLLAEEIEIEHSKRLRPDLKHKNEHEITARIESIDAAHYGVTLMGIRVLFTPQTKNKSPKID